MKINGIEVVKPESFAAYAQWLARCVTEGRPLVHYSCPHCASILNSTVPYVGDVSDTMANCPVCDGLYFRIIDNENGYPVVAVHTVPQPGMRIQ